MAYAEISHSSFLHNLKAIKQFLSPCTKILMMCKANGYGHGLLGLLPHLHLGDGVGLASFDFARHLRSQGYQGRIVMMQGFASLTELALCVDLELTVMVHHPHQVQLLSDSVLLRPLDCWFKVNTGMCRLGFEPNDFKEYYLKLQSCMNVNSSSTVLVTHLSSADDADSGVSEKQLALFSRLSSGMSVAKSVCNSAAIFSFPAYQYQWVRPGLALYGVSPFGSSISMPVQLEPVMTLKARVVSLRDVAAGECVGYGAAYQVQKHSKIAVVNIGYGDGYPRSIKSGTPVLIRGKRCPVVGRVSMDMITVDVSGLMSVTLQDEVTLWGRGLPIEEVAESSGCFAYEMLTGVTARVKVEIESNC